MNLKSLNSQDLDPDHSMKRGVEHSVIEEDEESIELEEQTTVVVDDDISYT